VETEKRSLLRRLRRTDSPELLAPAGNWDCARAAVAAGADAVYFGLPRFNARLRADNFTEEDLPALVGFLHDQGVRAFVAFNTLVFPSEMAAAESALLALDQAGVDAVIVQDIGLAQLMRACVPDIELHASTQMTVTSPEGAELAAKAGACRAVLARELSLRDIRKCRVAPIELEVFIHGALCVAYSGQCLTSEMLGQRSANRGECAQACRLPYQMIVDGLLHDLGDRRYLLSPQDLAGVNELPALLDAGVRSFKIEGRLKSPEYVAAVTSVYRKALDAALDHTTQLAPSDWDDLEMAFSRGLFTGWIHGVDHQHLVHARYGKKRGPSLGHVASKGHGWICLDTPPRQLAVGDGVVFENPSDTDRETGGRVTEIHGNKLLFDPSRIDLRSVPLGTHAWKTDDPSFRRRQRALFKGDVRGRGRCVDMVMTGEAGAPLAVQARCEDGRSCAITSSISLETARTAPLDLPRLREQMGRLGGTGFRLRELRFDCADNVMLPSSELNRLRRQIVTCLLDSGDAPVPAKPALAQLLKGVRLPAETKLPLLSALCRTSEQMQSALAAGIARLYLDFEDVRRYSEAVRQVRESGQAEVWLATPRIQKAGEEGFFRLIARACPDGVLVRNLGGISFFAGEGIRMVGDFSLNVSNLLTADFFWRQGLESLTPSLDLNHEQLVDLLRSGAGPYELIVHLHMPLFHMEHCVFAAFLSEGKDHTDCGRPCDRHKVELRDRVGMAHPLRADAGCRNTLFHTRAQSGAKWISDFLQAGARSFRVELLEEDAAQTRRVLSAYQRLLCGGLGGEGLARSLGAVEQLGVTGGTLVAGRPESHR